jgi:hypothetical protein
MHAQSFAYSPLQFRQAYHAMVLAFAQGASFTVAGFCACFKYKPNRHTRKVLNQMAAAGLLTKHKTLFDDGHYRMVYAAQKTARMTGL